MKNITRQHKKEYIKPKITRIVLDNSISLVMMSGHGNGNGHGNGHNNGHGNKPKGTFESPFNDSPFN
jgi:hypothetical protein